MAEKILPAGVYVPSKIDQAILDLETAHSLMDSLYTLSLMDGIDSLCDNTLTAQLDASMRIIESTRKALMADSKESAATTSTPANSCHGDTSQLINDGIASQAAIAGARRLFLDSDNPRDGDAEWQIAELLSSAYQRIEALCLKLEPKAA